MAGARSMTAGRSRSRTHESTTVPTASRASSARRIQLTHVHSFHLDDHSLYQDTHRKRGGAEDVDSELEGEDEGESEEPSGTSPGDLERGLSHASTRTDHEGGEVGPSGDTSEEDSEIYEPETVREDVTGVAMADLEKRETMKSSRSRRSKTRDPNLVTWDGPDDPANPKNWTTREKWVATFVVSSFTFISPVSSSMVAPSLQQIEGEFEIASFLGQMTLSAFVLAYAVGPLFIGPLSEMFGRVRVLQLSNLIFLVFNTACGAATNSGMLIAFRFLAGLGGSAPLAIGGGVLSDAWRTDQRGAAIAVYSLMPLVGPAVGPICGGFITQYSTWRWGFYATSIADAVVQLIGIFFLRETYPPEILHRKAKKLARESGNTELYTEYEHRDEPIGKHIRTALARPFRMLLTQPIVQALSLYMAFLYGTMYLLLSSFPLLWTERYGESVSIGGINYLSLGLGFAVGAQVSARLQDRIYKRLTKQNNGVGRPEFRVPLMIPGSLLTPIGLFLYGWSAQYHTHWIVPNIGAALFSFGTIMAFQCIQTFIVDSYTRYAASAIGAATVLRSLAGFGFPLFAPAMYDALGFGWGNSVLGFAAVLIGIPSPFLLWRFGRLLRERSTFAAGAAP